jgi:excisionase family DNA binding protein
LPRIKITKLEELPDILTSKQVADFLGISRGRIYEYCQMNPEVGGIESFTIGRSRKIEKANLIRWIEKRKQQDAG